ncbi:DUF1819 family protein [Haloflavibacter putidus]|uniref:DUF1819 family protein n=1 Tax=Haloflavibacter putidus TaxID=2576776 RepID=A0A507ZMQ3_9FLAO|nr:DUF1819 family protein [Haloflavibacter putidus]TQD38996.1 DUF1819 family protein [Haloflavibacter putidus]
MLLEEKYDFGFTALSLRVKELVKVAMVNKNKRNFDIIQEIGQGKTSSGKRFLIEINKRLDSLNEQQIDILLNGDFYEQKQIAFLAMCKVYGFIRDFVIEVCREKVLVFDYTLTEGEYRSFFRRKLETYYKMQNFTEATNEKIRQVLFRTLVEAGIIDNTKNKEIQPQLLDSKLMRVIANDDKKWLKLFFVSDIDIENFN